ncbi:MAG: cytochrome c oxidase subunit 3, partial [Vulcanimicrobiaceae bacterium]
MRAALAADQFYQETRDLRVTGFLLFMVSDLVLFSSFIFAYLYLRNTGQGWPPPGAPHLNLALAALNSVVLFGSGATIHFALENWKHEKFMKFAGWTLATIVLGIMFLSGQGIEYYSLYTVDHASWAGSGIFGASFFTLTGMHGLHVFAGIIYLTVLLLQATQGKYTFK